jgi:hypothetical protein
VEPWSRTAILHWRPQFSFFEQRSAILEEVESRGLLRAFTWEDGTIGLRVGEHEAVRCGAGMLEACALSPKADNDRLMEVVRLLLGSVAAEEVRITWANCMFVVPMESGDYEAAQRHFAEGASGELTPGADVIDAAVMVDGSVAGVPARFQVEYGVIGRHELEGRLQGQGRVAAPTVNLPGMWPDVSDAPACALFTTWVWQFAGLVPRGDASVYWESLLSHSAKLTSQILMKQGHGGEMRGEERA